MSHIRNAQSPSLRASTRNFVVPDIAIVCGAIERAPENQNTILNPKVIVEVLSPSTADYDYGGKFALYRGIASLQEYVLVSQYQALIEVFRKTSDGNWTLFSHRGTEVLLNLESLNIAIPLSQIYADIEFLPDFPDIG